LRFFRIANCDYVTEEFMYKLKERKEENELRIDLTHMNKEIDATTQIDVNIKINFLCRDFPVGLFLGYKNSKRNPIYNIGL